MVHPSPTSAIGTINPSRRMLFTTSREHPNEGLLADVRFNGGMISWTGWITGREAWRGAASGGVSVNMESVVKSSGLTANPITVCVRKGRPLLSYVSVLAFRDVGRPYITRVTMRRPRVRSPVSAPISQSSDNTKQRVP